MFLSTKNWKETPHFSLSKVDKCCLHEVCSSFVVRNRWDEDTEEVKYACANHLKESASQRGSSQLPKLAPAILHIGRRRQTHRN